MDSSLSSSFQLFFVSLAFLCCFAFADLVNDVCSKALNPALCLRALRGDSRSAGADLKGLGQISIGLATASAKSGVALVTKLAKQATDPRAKEIYSSCLENYNDSVERLGGCTGALKSGDYGGLNLKASAALDDPVTCDDTFKEAPNLPSEPSQLKDASEKLKGLCDIILVISTLL